MSDRITAILLVPHDPAMLADGPCGSRPPTVMRVEHRHECDDLGFLLGEDSEGDCTECGKAWPCEFAGQVSDPYWCSRANGWPTRALVLAWDGEVVPAGCDHAQEAYVGRRGHKHWFRAAVDAVFAEPGTDRAVLLRDYADQLVRDPRWTIILLNSEGREVRHD